MSRTNLHATAVASLAALSVSDARPLDAAAEYVSAAKDVALGFLNQQVEVTDGQLDGLIKLIQLTEASVQAAFAHKPDLSCREIAEKGAINDLIDTYRAHMTVWEAHYDKEPKRHGRGYDAWDKRNVELSKPWEDVRDEIIDYPASTLAGLLVKIDFIEREKIDIGDAGPLRANVGVASMFADIRRIAREA